MVLDASPEVAGLEIPAQLALIGSGAFSSQESRHVVGLHGMKRRANGVIVELSQVSFALEHDVSGILDLHQAPLIFALELLRDRAKGQVLDYGTSLPLGNRRSHSLIKNW